MPETLYRTKYASREKQMREWRIRISWTTCSSVKLDRESFYQLHDFYGLIPRQTFKALFQTGLQTSPNRIYSIGKPRGYYSYNMTYTFYNKYTPRYYRLRISNILLPKGPLLRLRSSTQIERIHNSIIVLGPIISVNQQLQNPTAH